MIAIWEGHHYDIWKLMFLALQFGRRWSRFLQILLLSTAQIGEDRRKVNYDIDAHQFRLTSKLKWLNNIIYKSAARSLIKTLN